MAARAAIEATIDERVTVVDKLDAIMKNRYANDPATLAEWASASHTERAPRRKKTPPTEPGGRGPTEPSSGG